MNKPQPYGYYHGNEADQYTFYRLPKALFTNARYKDLSDGANHLSLPRLNKAISATYAEEVQRAMNPPQKTQTREMEI